MLIRDNVTTLRSQILAAATSCGARDVRLFGSAARGAEGAESDVDFVVSLEPGRTLWDLARLEVRLEQLLGRRVDVVIERIRHMRQAAEAIKPWLARQRRDSGSASDHSRQPSHSRSSAAAQAGPPHGRVSRFSSDMTVRYMPLNVARSGCDTSLATAPFNRSMKRHAAPGVLPGTGPEPPRTAVRPQPQRGQP